MLKKGGRNLKGLRARGEEEDREERKERERGIPQGRHRAL